MPPKSKILKYKQNKRYIRLVSQKLENTAKFSWSNKFSILLVDSPKTYVKYVSTYLCNSNLNLRTIIFLINR